MDQPRPEVVTRDDLRGDGEWWLSDLCRELAMPQPTVHGWVRRGWVRGRKLPGDGGRWVLWADAEDLDRLRRLRAYRRSWPDEPYPPEARPIRKPIGPPLGRGSRGGGSVQGVTKEALWLVTGILQTARRRR
jgi:hypothetical protein